MAGDEVKSTMSWIKDFMNGKISKLDHPDGYNVGVEERSEQNELHTEIITKTPAGSEFRADFYACGLNGMILIRANRRANLFSPEKKANIRRYINRFFSEVNYIWEH